jgi:7-cyano-7-deazaguanine synthase
MNNQKSFVLLSGGIDSGTCLAIAMYNKSKFGGEVEAVSIDYGQRHIKETECAKALCEYYDVQHTILDCKSFLTQKTLLTDQDADMPNVSYDDLGKGISPTYVPFRNGFMLARLAAYAQEYNNSIRRHANESLEDNATIYFGAHAEDAKNHAYPDCTMEFIGAMANAIYIGSYRTIRLVTPFVFSEKAEIITKGKKLGVPYELTWSCYKGEEVHCGICPTCRARKAAFSKAGVFDPTVYFHILTKGQTE